MLVIARSQRFVNNDFQPYKIPSFGISKEACVTSMKMLSF
jgi:hypothetical protein